MTMKYVARFVSMTLGFSMLLLSAAAAQQQHLDGKLFLSSQSSQSPVELGPKDGRDLAPADLDRLKVGSTAFDFSLEDQNGKVVTLSSFREKKAVVLVFYRGKW